MSEKLTEDMKAKICSAISLGATRQMAARYAGCHRQTIWATAQEDKKFAGRLRKAEETPEIDYLTSIAEAANSGKHWRAARWSLERMYPETYGNRAPNTFTYDQLYEIVDKMISLISRSIPGKANREAVRIKLETYARSLASGDARKKLLRRNRHAKRSSTR